jgi:hypothetical protein
LGLKVGSNMSFSSGKQWSSGISSAILSSLPLTD